MVTCPQNSWPTWQLIGAHICGGEEDSFGRPHSIKLEVVLNGMYVFLPIVPNCIYTDQGCLHRPTSGGEIAREEKGAERCAAGISP